MGSTTNSRGSYELATRGNRAALGPPGIQDDLQGNALEANFDGGLVGRASIEVSEVLAVVSEVRNGTPLHPKRTLRLGSI